MRKLALALVASTLIALGGSGYPLAHAASAHAGKSTPKTSVTREIIKLDAMAGSKVVATVVFVHDLKQGITTATLTASRLRPRTAHAAAINIGRCNSFKGPVAHAFPVMHADKTGSAAVTLRFRGALSHDKWYVAIYAGPSLRSKGVKGVACGDVS